MLDRIWTPNPINWKHPLNRGRVAWWLGIPGLTGGPSLWDLSGKNPAALTSMPSGNGWSKLYCPVSPAGNVIKFGSGYITGPPCTSIFPTTSTQATIAVTTYPTNVTAVGKLYSYISSGSTRLGIAMAQVTAGQITFYGRNGASLVSINVAVSANTWYRVVVTYSVAAALMTAYLNGVSVGSTTIDSATFSALTSSPVYMGVFSDGSGLYNGYAGDFAAWNRTLSAFDVEQDYILSRQGYPGVLNRRRSMLPQLAGQAPVGVHNPYYYRQLQGAA